MLKFTSNEYIFFFVNYLQTECLYDILIIYSNFTFMRKIEQKKEVCATHDNYQNSFPNELFRRRHRYA